MELSSLRARNKLSCAGKRRDIEVKVVTSFDKFPHFEQTIPDSSHEATMSNTLHLDTTSDTEASFLHILGERIPGDIS